MRTTGLTVFVAVLCLAAWTAGAQVQQDQQAQQKAQQAQQQAQQAQQQAQEAQRQAQQMGQGGTQGGMQQMGQADQQALAPALKMSPNEQQIQGKIIGKSKDVDVQGDKEHRIVQVQTRQGQTMMVDLGRTDKLPDGFEVRENQWVIVTGVPGRVGNDQVLVAHNVANVFSFQPGAASHGGAQMEGGDQGLRQRVRDERGEQRTGQQSDGQRQAE